MEYLEQNTDKIFNVIIDSETIADTAKNTKMIQNDNEDEFLTT